MKKVWYAIAILMVVLAGFAFWVQQSAAQPAWLGGDAAGTEEQDVPPVISAPSDVIVDAIVVPVRAADLSMATSGIVQEVLVSEGDSVAAGAPLVRLNAARQEAAVAQAEANLRRAELKLAELQAPPRTEQIARYQADVASAQAALQDVQDGPTDTALAAARAALANAEAELRQAQSDYDEVAWRTDVGMLPQATALEKATNNYVKAQAELEDLQAGASQASINSASAKVQAAQSELDLLLAGETTETLAAAEADVTAAAAARQEAQAALDETTLRAPFAGTVGAVNVEVGEQVSPGTPAVQLADLSAWRVETDDLTELNVVKVQRGDRVEIEVDALPEVELSGRVTNIKPVGESKQGDIIYTVLIKLDEQDDRLYWNMTAQATIIEDEAGRAAAQEAQPPTAKTVADFMQEEASTRDAAAGATVETVRDDRVASAAVQSETLAATADNSVVATVQTSGANLNVRSGPGTEHAIIGKVQNGDNVTVLARSATDAWLLVATPDGNRGWVSADYVGLTEPVDNLPVSDTLLDTPPDATLGTANAETNVNTQTVQPVSARPAVSLEQTPISDLDGTLVFQESSGGTIYAYNLASGELWPLTSGMDPAISPDGGTVAFVRGGGENGLYLIDIDGGNERLIYSGGEGLRAPTWSPDGQQIAFSRVTGESTCRSVATSICVEDNEFLDGFPLVSSDLRGLSQVDINGENFRDIATLNTAESPDWNAAGIVYASKAGIQVTDDPRDDETRVVAAEFRYRDPNWQPGGGRIVVQSQEGDHRELFSMNADGSDLVILTRPTNLLAEEYPQNVAPVWSPDGEHIAFLSNRTADGAAGEWAIWMMDADGGNQRRLPLDVAITYRFQNEQVLDWS